MPAERTLVGLAEGLLTQRPTWAEFHREIFGIDGAIRRLFPTAKDLVAFKQTATYVELLAMLSLLRSKDESEYGPGEPQRVITLRIPKTLHESLRADAHDGRTSMNQLCIARLLGLTNDQ
jgi:predicted HicB family RNase H-like nuclease